MTTPIPTNNPHPLPTRAAQLNGLLISDLMAAEPGLALIDRRELLLAVAALRRRLLTVYAIRRGREIQL